MPNKLKEGRITTAAQLTREMHQFLADRAEEEFMSISGYVRQLIKNEMKRYAEQRDLHRVHRRTSLDSD